MSTAGFEPATSSSDRPQTGAVDRANTEEFVMTPKTITRKMYRLKDVGTFRLAAAVHCRTLSSTPAFRCLHLCILYRSVIWCKGIWNFELYTLTLGRAVV